MPAQQQGRTVTVGLQPQKNRRIRGLIATHRVVFDQGIALSRVLGPAHQEVGATVAEILQAQAVGGKTVATSGGLQRQGDVAGRGGVEIFEQEAQGTAAGVFQGEAEVGVCGVSQLFAHVGAVEEQGYISGDIRQAIALTGEQVGGKIKIGA